MRDRKGLSYIMKKIEIDKSLCKGCSLCVEVCPKNVIKIDTEDLNSKGYNPAAVSDVALEACISCAMCAKMCPDCAITVYK